MTYEEVQEFLFSQLPMYQRQGASAMKKSLDNIIMLCDILGNPQDKITCIHIAGTNGKGSTAHYIAAGLQAHGYSVGLYTSPHYKDYRERIKINAQLITESDVVDFVVSHYDQFTRIQPSFFEITVAMAFDHFARNEVDIAVIETGLGGRLDSTNIITPILSIITNISYDHMAMLGDTLPEIAGEKAGIIKSEIPVIIGEDQPEIAHVFTQKAADMNSPLMWSSTMIDMKESSDHIQCSSTDAQWTMRLSAGYTPYQIKNLRTAISALYHLKDKYQLKDQTVAEGLENAAALSYYIGRWMKLSDRPLVICDSAHNEAGIEHLTMMIKKCQYNRLHIVFGAASDKDLDGILSMLPRTAQYYFAKADIPRGMPTDRLQTSADTLGLSALSFASVPAAYRVALASAAPDDMVIIAGSIFVVAEVL